MVQLASNSVVLAWSSPRFCHPFVNDVCGHKWKPFGPKCDVYLKRRSATDWLGSYFALQNNWRRELEAIVGRHASLETIIYADGKITSRHALICRPCSVPFAKILLLFFRNANQAICHPVPPEGRCATSSTRDGDAVDADGAFEADGESVWSWHRGAGVKSCEYLAQNMRRDRGIVSQCHCEEPLRRSNPFFPTTLPAARWIASLTLAMTACG
jgi:hypothetical protein